MASKITEEDKSAELKRLMEEWQKQPLLFMPAQSADWPAISEAYLRANMDMMMARGHGFYAHETTAWYEKHAGNITSDNK
jgi:hypothetical protein